MTFPLQISVLKLFWLACTCQSPTQGLLWTTKSSKKRIKLCKLWRTAHQSKCKSFDIFCQRFPSWTRFAIKFALFYMRIISLIYNCHLHIISFTPLMIGTLAEYDWDFPIFEFRYNTFIATNSNDIEHFQHKMMACIWLSKRQISIRDEFIKNTVTHLSIPISNRKMDMENFTE